MTCIFRLSFRYTLYFIEFNRISCQHGGKTNVDTAFTDRLCFLVTGNVDGCFFLFRIDFNTLCDGRRESSCNIDLRNRGVFDTVDILSVELFADSVDTYPFDTDSRTDRVYIHLIGFQCDLCTFSRNTCRTDDLNHTVCDLRYFICHECLKKLG